jgi:hypothetical protein
MPSKYEEMCAAAEMARKEWADQSERCSGYMKFIVNGFLQYCGISPDRITLLRRNGASGPDEAYLEKKEGGHYLLTEAIVFDEKDGYWHMGLAITVSQPGVFPPSWFGFAVCVKEKDGQVVVKTGLDGMPQQLDLNQPAQCNGFYEGLAKICEQSLRDGRKPPSKRLGFLTEA